MLTTFSKVLLYSGMLKSEQLMVTQWYTADTRRYTVGSLVMENAMALRTEPLCRHCVPPCPTVLKLAVAKYEQLQFMLTTFSKVLLYSGMLKSEQLMVTQWYTADTRRYTVGSLVVEHARVLQPEPLCRHCVPPCPSVLKLAAANYELFQTPNHLISNLAH